MVAQALLGAPSRLIPAALNILYKRFIHVAPCPTLAGFLRPDQGMLRAMEMLRRMLVLRTVAAPYVPACQTNA